MLSKSQPLECGGKTSLWNRRLHVTSTPHATHAIPPQINIYSFDLIYVRHGKKQTASTYTHSQTQSTHTQIHRLCYSPLSIINKYRIVHSYQTVCKQAFYLFTMLCTVTECLRAFYALALSHYLRCMNICCSFG